MFWSDLHELGLLVVLFITISIRIHFTELLVGCIVAFVYQVSLALYCKVRSCVNFVLSLHISIFLSYLMSFDVLVVLLVSFSIRMCFLGSLDEYAVTFFDQVSLKLY